MSLFSRKFWKPGTEAPDSALNELRNHILYLLEKYQTVVIVGETGCFIDLIPQYLLEAGWAEKGYMIGVTQPRRVAAVTVASRVAEERGSILGAEVGYTIRFEDCSEEKITKVKFLTDGLLIREIMGDPLLKKYSVIMLDEAHERSLNTDIILGLLRKIQKKRTDLRIIIASATLDAEEMRDFFNNNETGDKSKDTASIMTIEGRNYPVDIHYSLDPVPDYLKCTVETVMKVHNSEKEGDILAFLTGQDEVEAVVRMLIDEAKKIPRDGHKMKVLPMYGTLPSSEQMKVFERTSRNIRKIVIATNIAEASITINGIVYKESYQKLPLATVPEMQRSDLAPVVLQLKALGIINIIKFHFLSPPPAQNMVRGLELLYALDGKKLITSFIGIRGRPPPAQNMMVRLITSYRDKGRPPAQNMVRGLELLYALDGKGLITSYRDKGRPPAQNMVRGLGCLYALDAIDEDCNLTSPLGLQMAEFPLTPMFSKMLLESKACIIFSGNFGCSEEAITVAAMTQIQNVFVTPSGNKSSAARSRRKFSVEEGDHVTLINVFNSFIKYKKSSKWCHEYFLNYKGLCRAVEIRHQLARILKKFNVPLVSCGGR
ncbi:DHX35 [Mytilus edulis]|uniref:RNA helicase n=1 Tax=Mytilus edulis TaxID=6550 RepID=A0A8S3VD49_MYTED|nr:DHX35 [Mytilus edulis]